MKRVIAGVVAALALEANACGICIDDKVASCYDHAVVTGAKARGDAVAFLAIDGSLPVNAEMRRAVLRAVRGAGGVLPGTARVSLENAALSFAYDPRRASVDAIRAALEARLAPRGLQLRLLREMR